MIMEKLFSYGTLQYESVQLATFNRLLEGRQDILIGYQLEQLKIMDPDVIQLSGEDVHRILVATGNAEDQVTGTVFDLSVEELKQADAYEVDDYKRIQVTLSSGTTAWVYVAVEDLTKKTA